MDRNEELRNYLKAASELFVFDGEFGEVGHAQKEVARAQFDAGGGRHLSNDEMITFCQERMSGAEREAARPHILHCDECLQLFKEVNDFFGPRREDKVKIDELQVRRAWKEFWPQARDIKEAISDAIEPPHGGISRAKWLMAAAAGLLLMLGAPTVFVVREKQEKEQAQLQIVQMQNERSKLEARLGQVERTAVDQLKQEREQRAQAEARAQVLQNRLNELQQSRQNVPIYSLMLSSQKGGGDDWQLNIPSTAKTFWLRLTRAKPSEFPEYSIELIDQLRKTVAERRGLRPVDGYLNFALSGSETPAGKYSLLLYGHRGKLKQRLGEYELSLSSSH
jgi:hypothetical protein